MTLTKTQGTSIEVAGAIAVFVGGVFATRTCPGIAIAVLLGAAAIYIGRLIVAKKSV